MICCSIPENITVCTEDKAYSDFYGIIGNRGIDSVQECRFCVFPFMVDVCERGFGFVYLDDGFIAQSIHGSLTALADNRTTFHGNAAQCLCDVEKLRKARCFQHIVYGGLCVPYRFHAVLLLQGEQYAKSRTRYVFEIFRVDFDGFYLLCSIAETASDFRASAFADVTLPERYIVKRPSGTSA